MVDENEAAGALKFPFWTQMNADFRDFKYKELNNYLRISAKIRVLI